MSSKQLPWFRMYTEAVDDEKLRLLAFEDRWHFVALLCCKGQGVLDDAGPLLMRKVAVKLGLDVRTLEDVARRLAEVGLIDEKSLQPIAWDERQMRSDSSTERVRAYRERMKQEGNVSETFQEQGGAVTVTAQDTDTDTDKEGEEKKSRSRSLSVKALVAEGVKKTHAEDWLTLRKAKRLPLTQTAWDAVKAEAEKVGMTPAQAVQHSVESNWAGFKAKWIEADAAKAGATAAGTTSAAGEWWTSKEGIEAKAAELGMTQGGEVFLWFRIRVCRKAGEGPWRQHILREFARDEGMTERLNNAFYPKEPDA
ncbi:hypothetical protein LJR296_001430 [Cupriavidus necator]|uniref:hypothetical protein n=1 Tax=Cupriavidus necator TaxID=106590 RepID=UPI003ECC60BF